jgi:hypothetical protein
MKQEKGKINRVREEDKYHKNSRRTRRRNKILRERTINENKRWRKNMCRRRNMKQTEKGITSHIFFFFTRLPTQPKLTPS